MRTAHLADDRKPTTTLCGLPWEAWQEPKASDEDIGFDNLPYSVKRAVREGDEAEWQGHDQLVRRREPIHQCQACFKAAMRLAETAA